MRTQAEIIAQCEARQKYLDNQKYGPIPERACLKCKWGKPNWLGPHMTECTQPLILGHEDIVFAWDCQDGTHYDAKLCGPEKALWKPIPVKLTFWQRIKSCLNNL